MRLPAVALGARELKRQRPLLVGTDVRTLQQLLKWLGFFNSKVDGIFGYETGFGVRLFQKALGIKQNGIVDTRLLDILQDMENGKAGKWVTVGKNFCHTGYSPVPVPFKLRVTAAKRIPGIIDFLSLSGSLIAVARSGIWCMDMKNFGTIWRRKRLSPVAAASVTDSKIIVPAGDLVILDLYSGKIQATLDSGDFATPAAAGRDMIVASAGGSAYAFDESGNKLWRYRTEGALLSPPAMAYDLIYFASSDHYFYCLDAKGIPYWKTNTGDIISGPPAVWDSKIFAISRDSWFYAFNPLNGDIIWKKKFSDQEFTAPAFHRDFMLTADAKGRLLALSPQRAEIKWLKEMEVEPSTPALLCPATAFIGTQDGLAVIDLSTGNNEFYLKGKKITAIIQARFDIIAATEDAMVVLSPDV